jgi:hypothetical protein
MTMIDETTLSSSLHAAANDFLVSRDAIDRILSEAGESQDTDRRYRVPDFVRQAGRGRNFWVAAALVLAVGAIALPLSRGVNNGVSAIGPRTLAPNLGAAGLSIVTNQGSAYGQTSSPDLSATGQSSAKSRQSLKIESSGTMAMTVPNGSVQTTLTSLGALAAKDGGFVDSTQATASSRSSATYSNATIVLQVPQRLFATLVAQIQHVGHATSINVQSNDVTSQYVGLQSRITALEASRHQYLSIMTRATTIGDILAVQTQLNTLQSQIEQLQGQMNLLDNEIDYGSLSVQLSDVSHAPTTAPSSGIDKAARASVAGFVAGCEWLVKIAGPVLFATLLLGALFIAGKFTRRALRRRRI